jgi:gamma-glutamyltranspeptidase/glutathione hydrolase
MYTLVDPDSVEAGFFGWPVTEENRHVMGPHSIAVPGTLAGLSYALGKYGTMSLAEVLEPAIALAEDGFPVTWQFTYLVTKALKAIRSQSETARTFLNAGGDPPFTENQANPAVIRQPDLARTLRAIAAAGPDVLYRGELGHTIATYLESEGVAFSVSDLENYDVREIEPATAIYHGHTVYAPTNGSGGTSLTQAMKAMNLVDTGSSEHRTADQWHTIASIFRQAFADRFTYLADPDQVEVPLQALHSDEYARRTVDDIGDSATVPTAASREALGVSHQLEASVPDYMKDGSTTHLSVIDGDGNAVSLTQTLLSLFGSFVTIPGTGMLMNNGMMWFDPEPGRPNSVGGGKRPLSNMAPVLIEKDGTIVASLGASGGRKIMNCNAQLVMNIVDGNMSAQDAIDVPRIDCSTSAVMASSRISDDVLEELRNKGYKVQLRQEALLTGDFSSPVAVRRSSDGILDGGADPWYFAATVVGVEDS